LIQSAAVNAARFDHTSAGVCRGLLIEESRTNVALYSNAIVVNQGWNSPITVTTSGTAPDGSSSYEISEITSSSQQIITNNGGTGSIAATSITSGTTYTGSIFLKKVTGSIDWVQISFAGAGFGTTQYANINISNGTIGNSSGGTARVEAYANGWYRVSWTAVATTTIATSNIILGFIQNTNGTARLPSYAGSPANKFLAAMAQFEVGSFATSYIPTVASSVVRSADVCSITGQPFLNMYNPLEGSLATSVIFNAPVTYGTGQLLVDINDTTTTNRLRYFRNATAGTAGFANNSAGNTNVSITSVSSIQSSVTQKYSAGFKLDDYAFYVNNSQIGTDNLGAMVVSPTTLTIGDASAGGARQYTNGTIAAIRYYKKRLPNAKLAQLTV
jgi:hypothetical protein